MPDTVALPSCAQSPDASRRRPAFLWQVLRDFKTEEGPDCEDHTFWILDLHSACD